MSVIGLRLSTTSAVVAASHGSDPRLVSERCLMAARMPLTLMVLTITVADTSRADQRTERARTAEIGPIFAMVARSAKRASLRYRRYHL
jgi:hypothetical protein